MSTLSFSVVDKIVLAACFVVPTALIVWLFVEPIYIKWVEKIKAFKSKVDWYSKQIDDLYDNKNRLWVRLMKLEKAQKFRKKNQTKKRT